MMGTTTLPAHFGFSIVWTGIPIRDNPMSHGTNGCIFWKALSFLRWIVSTTTLSAHFGLSSVHTKIPFLAPRQYSKSGFSDSSIFAEGKWAPFPLILDYRVYNQGLDNKTNPEIACKWWSSIWNGPNCLRRMLYTLRLSFWLQKETKLTVGLLHYGSFSYMNEKCLS